MNREINANANANIVQTTLYYYYVTMQQNSEMITQTQTDLRSQVIKEKHLLCLFVYFVVAPRFLLSRLTDMVDMTWQQLSSVHDH